METSRFSKMKTEKRLFPIKLINSIFIETFSCNLRTYI
ncbi:hypothetical protein KIS1582_3809 [Cytobacillus firmus]|uniref:Uncharacterized protein n=1 Tax=Cytobacillus firmus TaxID=1399 RepID=A0A800MU08_CYTFI|nr:hypothetical protein KIS1582_3809 [Cytobacillus firmus]